MPLATPFTRLRASAFCMLMSFAAGCDRTPPASADAVALVEEVKLDRSIVLVIARSLVKDRVRGASGQAACIEAIAMPEVSQSVARALDAGMGKEDIAGVLAFYRTPHGKKFADAEWARTLKQIEGTWTVMPELTAQETAAVAAYTASPQHARFAAAAKVAAGTHAHEIVAKPVIERCEIMK